MGKSTQPIPPGHENLIPHLVCSPCSEAIEFYRKAFGAQEVNRMLAPDGRRIMHAALRIGQSFLFLVNDFPEFCGGKSSTPLALGGTPVSIHHYVEDCDAAIKRRKTPAPPSQCRQWTCSGAIVMASSSIPMGTSGHSGPTSKTSRPKRCRPR